MEDDSEEEMEAAPVKQWKKSDVSACVLYMLYQCCYVITVDTYADHFDYVLGCMKIANFCT